MIFSLSIMLVRESILILPLLMSSNSSKDLAANMFDLIDWRRLLLSDGAGRVIMISLLFFVFSFSLARASEILLSDSDLVSSVTWQFVKDIWEINIQHKPCSSFDKLICLTRSIFGFSL